MKNKVTEEQVDFWIGWDNPWQIQKSEMLNIITSIANGEYPPKVLREDIINTCLSEEE